VARVEIGVFLLMVQTLTLTLRHLEAMNCLVHLKGVYWLEMVEALSIPSKGMTILSRSMGREDSIALRMTSHTRIGALGTKGTTTMAYLDVTIHWWRSGF